METTISTSCGKVIIRPTRNDDAPAFRELRLEALWMHPEAFSSDHASNAARPMAWWVERVQQGSGEGRQATYVAENSQNELIAMCGVYREEDIKLAHNANIWGLYVRPAWRGHKIANALMDACENWAAGRDIRFLRLCVVTSNAAAIRCYRRRGFVASGCTPECIHVDGKYHDEHLMFKRLTTPKAEP
jgi:ribosomal protein S18 acetylase RimI-like enzyme